MLSTSVCRSFRASLHQFFGIALTYLMLIMNGCTSTHQESAQAFTQEVSVEQDGVAGFTSYQGTILKEELSDDDSTNSIEYLLYALKPKNGKTQFFVMVSNQYDGHWKQYLHAIDQDGRRYESLSISNHPSCELFCKSEDRLDFEIPESLLTSHIKQGLEFRLEGPSNQLSPAFNLPPTYLIGFIARIHPTQ